MSRRHQGYGYRHQKLRKQCAAKVRAGIVRCARCGEPIDPDCLWGLGHDDYDRTSYNGPEHASCNRIAAGRRRCEAASYVRPQSRDW